MAVEEVGLGVTAWKVGQRVGVGFFGGEDGTCEACRRGDTAYCQNPIVTGVASDGSFAEMMIAEARALALILKNSNQRRCGPLGMCRHYDLQRTPEQWDVPATPLLSEPCVFSNT